MIPAGRFGEVEDGIELAMYLLIEHSTIVSETTHVVDGGMMPNIRHSRIKRT